MIEQRLSTLSSSEIKFSEAKQPYEHALEKSGYDVNLTYLPSAGVEPLQKRQRKRNVIWFNPPYSSHVKSNIGRQFSNLIAKHFPKHHRYHKLFNKNNLKLSYSCMPNMKSIIDKHNFKILNGKEKQTRMCNCRNPNECPLSGQCLSESVVYRADVKTDGSDKIYVGLTERPFKSRYADHTNSFDKRKYMSKTELSKCIWTLKDKEVDFDIKWDIIVKSAPYICGSRKCDLCLSEKLIIARADPGKLLNSRAEIISKCRHQNKFTLKNFKFKT